MPAGVPWSTYLKTLTASLLAMFAGAEVVHRYYRPDLVSARGVDCVTEPVGEVERLLGQRVCVGRGFGLKTQSGAAARASLRSCLLTRDMVPLTGERCWLLWGAGVWEQRAEVARRGHTRPGLKQTFYSSNNGNEDDQNFALEAMTVKTINVSVTESSAPTETSHWGISG